MERKTKQELISIAKKLDINNVTISDKKSDIIKKINKYQIQKINEYKKRKLSYGGSILPYESGIGGAYSQPSFLDQGQMEV